MKVEVTVLSEINDHCGHCTDNENDYEYTNETFIFDLPDSLKMFSYKSGDNILFSNYNWDNELLSYTKKIKDKINHNGSYCCSNFVKGGLDRHDFRISVIKAIVM